MLLVLSAFAAYLFFSGWLLTSFAVHSGDLVDRIGLSLAAGLLGNLCLMLTGLTIPRVLGAGVAVAVIGVVKWASDVRKGAATDRRGTRETMVCLAAIAYVLGVYYLYIFSEPLIRWDARSIWFFHARMIWIDGAIRPSGGWNHPSIVFSHPNYPKLGPALGAELAYLKGYWNEFIPKGSLLLLLAPPIVWAFTVRKKAASFWFLLLTFVFGLDGWLSNGMMDGYVVLYAGAALLLVGRYFADRRDVDMAAAMCAAGIAASLKYEGLLFALCLAVTLCFGPGAPEFGIRRLPARLRSDPRSAAILTLAIAPTVLWTIAKRAFGIGSEYAGPGAWGRISSRLLDPGSARYLIDFLSIRANQLWIGVAIVAAASAFLYAQRIRWPRGTLIAAATAALYTLGIAVVYLSTPYGFEWHISSSATRTMATADMALLVGLYFVLSALERHRPEKAPTALSTSARVQSHPV